MYDFYIDRDGGVLDLGLKEQRSQAYNDFTMLMEERIGLRMESWQVHHLINQFPQTRWTWKPF